MGPTYELYFYSSRLCQQIARRGPFPFEYVVAIAFQVPSIGEVLPIALRKIATLPIMTISRMRCLALLSPFDHAIGRWLPLFSARLLLLLAPLLLRWLYLRYWRSRTAASSRPDLQLGSGGIWHRLLLHIEGKRGHTSTESTESCLHQTRDLGGFGGPVFKIDTGDGVVRCDDEAAAWGFRSGITRRCWRRCGLILLLRQLGP